MSILLSKKYEINGRIREIRNYFCNGDNKKFAEMLGKTEAYASALCTKASVGAKIQDKIIEVFPEVNRAWLAVGEGDMIGQNVRLTRVNISADEVANERIVAAINETDSISRLISVVERQQSQIDELVGMLKDSTKKA